MPAATVSQLMTASEAHHSLAAIKSILARYDDYSGRLNVPGDWGERAFRGWLMMDLLRDVLGWPSAHIVLGERFDLLLLDSTLHPVVNVETKRPNYTATSKERRDFEQRLSFYGTLRWAFITNGQHWSRLEMLAPKGTQTIANRRDINVAATNAEQAAEFFGVIEARQFLA